MRLIARRNGRDTSGSLNSVRSMIDILVFRASTYLLVSSGEECLS